MQRWKFIEDKKKSFWPRKRSRKNTVFRFKDMNQFYFQRFLIVSVYSTKLNIHLCLILICLFNVLHSFFYPYIFSWTYFLGRERDSILFFLTVIAFSLSGVSFLSFFFKSFFYKFPPQVYALCWTKDLVTGECGKRDFM